MPDPFLKLCLTFDYGHFLWASRTGEKPFEAVEWDGLDRTVPLGLRRRCEAWHRREEESQEGDVLDDESRHATGRLLAVELENVLGVTVEYKP